MVFQGMITGGDLESKCKGIVTSHVRVNREPGYKLGTFARTEQKIIYSGGKDGEREMVEVDRLWR